MDISIQFHANPDELIELVEWCLKERSLYAVALRRKPFLVVNVTHDTVARFVKDVSYREVAFSCAKLLLAETEPEFIEKNPDALHLEMGHLTEKGLKESWLAARTDNESAFGVWKSVAHHVRAITRTGAIAVNPVTGATSRSRSHRFTEGARKVYLNGTPILSVGGLSLLKLGD